MDYNDAISNINRQIEASNLQSRLRQQERVKKVQEHVSDLEGKQEADIGEAGLGLVASKGKPIEAVGKGLKALPKAIDELGNAFENITEPADSVMRKLQTSYPTSTFEDLSTSLKGEVAVGESVTERLGKYGALGTAGVVASLGQGLYDVVQDIDAGKIVGKNSEERKANILGMASGALEGVGTALDLTGVAAPVGVAFNILGGLAGLAGSVEDVIGKSEEEKAETKQVQQEQAPQQKLKAYQDIGSSGAIVKQAQG